MTKPTQQTIIYVIFATIITLAVLLIFFKRAPAAAGEIIFYYGDGCVHCERVEEYVSQNGVDKKIPFTSKEVFSNQTNSNELITRYQTCGLPTDNVGVPLLWDGTAQKCYTGDSDIINYFSSKI
jgi:hypothetical protein